MENELNSVLDDCLKTPRATGVIVINDFALCIGHRGDLHESDAAPIAELIAGTSTGSHWDATGQFPYAGQFIQFHRTSDYTLAILRNTTSSPASSITQTEVAVSKSIGSAVSGGTSGTIKAPQSLSAVADIL